MSVRVENGRIIDGHGDDEREYDPTEARQHAAELIAAADECERQQRDTEAACKREGHDWGPWLNGYSPWRNHARRCQRGCRFGYEQEPGWMPFAGLHHTDPVFGGMLECCGPGCEHCATMRLGSAIRELFADARERLDAFVFGEDRSR